MRVVAYSQARNALNTLLDAVVEDADVAIIHRRTPDKDAVVMSLASYNSLIETLYLLSTPANAAALERAIQQDWAGEAKTRELRRLSDFPSCCQPIKLR